MTQGFALLLTLVTEMASAAIFMAVLGWGSSLRAAAAAAIATLATHWLAWWLALALTGSLSYVALFVGIETGVVLAESLVYRFVVPLGGRRALAISFLVNGCSAVLGLMLASLNLN